MDIVVQNLTKTYGSQKAVDNISFRVKTGEILGFLGPNGAGKTTTMKMITSFLLPDSGDVFLGNQSAIAEQEQTKKNIGYLPENNPLYEDMPVVDYLKFVGELQQIPKEKLMLRLHEIIDLAGLDDEKHKKIGELSKGYRQRVGLAQALIHDPEVLILDEPTSGLDPNQIVEIRELIKKIGKEKTVILSSHILAEVEATCDRILIINKGKIVADGTSGELRKKAEGKDVLLVCIEDGKKDDIFKSLQELSGVAVVDFSPKGDAFFEIEMKPDHQVAREVFELCKSKGWVITQMVPVETKLEDVFRELTV